MKVKDVIFNRGFDLLFSFALIGAAVSLGGYITIWAGFIFFGWQVLVIIATLVANPLNGQFGKSALLTRCVFIGLVALGFVPAMFAAQRDIDRRQAEAYAAANPPKPYAEWASAVSRPETNCFEFAKWKKDHQWIKDYDFCTEFAANPVEWRAKTSLLLEQRGFQNEADSLSGRTAAAIAEVKANPEKCEKYKDITQANERSLLRAPAWECHYMEMTKAEAEKANPKAETTSSLWK